MEILGPILNTPITQILSLILIWALAERMGLPLTKIVSKALRLNGHGREAKADNEWTRGIAGQTFDEIKWLRTHYNDEVTPVLEDILKEMKEHNRNAREFRQESKDYFKEIQNKHDNWEKYGVPTNCSNQVK